MVDNDNATKAGGDESSNDQVLRWVTFHLDTELYGVNNAFRHSSGGNK